MLDTTAFVVAAVMSPLVGEAVCQWVAGKTKKEDTEEKAKLRQKKKRTKRSRFSFLFSTLMVAAVLITWVYLPSSAKYVLTLELVELKLTRLFSPS